MADKAERILEFLRRLAELGLLSEIVGEMIKGLSWVDYLRLGLQLLLFVGSFFLTAGSATAARIAVALGVALLEITNKVRKIVKSD